MARSSRSLYRLYLNLNLWNLQQRTIAIHNQSLTVAEDMTSCRARVQSMSSNTLGRLAGTKTNNRWPQTAYGEDSLERCAQCLCVCAQSGEAEEQLIVNFINLRRRATVGSSVVI